MRGGRRVRVGGWEESEGSLSQRTAENKKGEHFWKGWEHCGWGLRPQSMSGNHKNMQIRKTQSAEREVGGWGVTAGRSNCEKKAVGGL